MNPLISIIVTSYCPESKRYLDLCMDSIAHLAYPNVETIVVGRFPDYLPAYENARTISPPKSEFLNGEGINYGVEHSSGEYLFILNDDVVLTRHCIDPLINSLASGQLGQVMPAGNDQQGRYWAPRTVRLFNEMVDHSPETMWDCNEAIADWPCVMIADTLCLYAHMLKRSTWDKVGGMDDGAGLIDIDYSLRMRQAGLLNAIEFSSLVWHFGGRSVEHTLDGPKRVRQKEQFKAKWGWAP